MALKYYEIPLKSGTPSFKFRTELGGVEFVLLFEWNTRCALWHISIFDASEKPIGLCSIPMLIDTEILSRFKVVGMPEGYLIFADGSGANLECGYDEIGDRCRLIYGINDE